MKPTSWKTKNRGKVKSYKGIFEVGGLLFKNTLYPVENFAIPL